MRAPAPRPASTSCCGTRARGFSPSRRVEGSMILMTDRLRLEPLTRADAPLVYPLRIDPEVMAHWDAPEIDDPDVVAGVVAQQVADGESGTARYWTMRTIADGEFVGVCDLSEIDRSHHKADVGFMLRRE